MTLIPALLVTAVGVGPQRPRLSWSRRSLLSFGIPFALIPLVILTASAVRHGCRGQPPVHHPAAAVLVVAVVVLFNAALLYLDHLLRRP